VERELTAAGFVLLGGMVKLLLNARGEAPGLNKEELAF
jgi:hypothetical protein